MVTKTYLPYNLCESSDSSDGCDSSNSFESSDGSDSNDQRTFFHPKKKLTQKNFFTIFFLHKKNYKLNLTTRKIKLWWNSKPQMVMKFKNSNCDETQKL